MKNYIGAILLLLLLSLFNACDEGSFRQDVEVDIPEHESAIALKGRYLAQDTILELLVSNSKGILDESEFNNMQNAMVRWYKDDVLLGNFTFHPETYRFKYRPDEPLPEDRSIYRIEVEAPNFEAVMTEQQMPSAVPILEAIVTDEGAISDEGERVDEVTIKFTDPAGEENYYAIQLFAKLRYYDELLMDTLTLYSEYYLDTYDQVIRRGSELDLVFSDKSFDGSTYTMQLFSLQDVPFNSDYEIVARLTTLTRDAFLYEVSLEQYFNALDNPFAEPVIVHSNVDDGYGVFTLGASTELVAEER